jgi:hypothetical protein
MLALPLPALIDSATHSTLLAASSVFFHWLMVVAPMQLFAALLD